MSASMHASKPDEYPRETIVRNIKSGKLAWIASTARMFEGEPVYSVYSVRDGRPFGPIRTLRHSQVEEAKDG